MSAIFWLAKSSLEFTEFDANAANSLRHADGIRTDGGSICRGSVTGTVAVDHILLARRHGGFDLEWERAGWIDAVQVAANEAGRGR